MSRSMMIIANCDHCGVKGDEDLFAMDVVIDIPILTKKPKVVDLCTSEVPDGKDCKAQFNEQMGPWLAIASNADAPSRIEPVRAPRKSTAARTTTTKRPAASAGATASDVGKNRVSLEQQQARLDAGNGVACDVPDCDRGPQGGAFIGGSAVGVATHKSRYHGIPGQSAEAKRRRSQS